MRWYRVRYFLTTEDKTMGFMILVFCFSFTCKWSSLFPFSFFLFFYQHWEAGSALFCVRTRMDSAAFATGCLFPLKDTVYSRVYSSINWTTFETWCRGWGYSACLGRGTSFKAYSGNLRSSGLSPLMRAWWREKLTGKTSGTKISASGTSTAEFPPLVRYSW